MPLPPTYRDQVGAAQLDTMPINDGGAQRAEALAGVFRQAGDISYQVGAKLRSAEGQKAGQEAGATGSPDFKKGFKTLTAYGAAYNDAATRSYAIKADGDAAITAARLESEADNDPDLFKSTMTAARDATISAAPPEAHGIIADIYNQRLSSGYVRVQGAQMKEIKDQSRATLSDGRDQLVEEISQQLASQNPIDREKAVLGHEKLTMLIDSARVDGTISAAEADALHLDATHEIIKQTHLAEFDQVLNNPRGDPAAYIESMDERNKTDGALPPDEEAKLHAALMAKMRDHNALEAEKHRNDVDEQKIRWAAGEKDVTERLLKGTLTNSYLLKQTQLGNIDPQIARTLRSTLMSPENEKSDPATLQFFSLNLLDESESTIASNPKLIRADQTMLIQRRRTETAPDAWQGTEEARTARDRIDRSLGIIPGSIDQKMIIADPAKYEEWQNAHTAFENAVEGTDPAQRRGHMVEIAQNIIGKNITKANVTKRDQIQKSISDLKLRFGDPSKHNRAEVKEYQDTLSKWQTQLDAAQRGQQ